jgi:tetratricopeptide (TPR) repeat protein
MRKNNSKVLRKPNKNVAKNGVGHSSSAQTKVLNGSITSSKESGKSPRGLPNTNEKASWKDDKAFNDALQVGIDCQRAGNYEAAIKAFEQAVKRWPNYSIGFWFLAGVYQVYLEKPEPAIPYYRQAVRLSPKSEMASLGLFHSLWNTDQIDEAIAEIKRYQTLTNWKSKDYLEIVAEMHEQWVDHPKKKKPKKRKVPL